MRKCKVTVRSRVKTSEGIKIESSTHDGLFHGWGVDYTEFNTGGAEYSIAIVENSDGKVMMVRADDIQFVDEEVDPPMLQTET